MRSKAENFDRMNKVHENTKQKLECALELLVKCGVPSECVDLLTNSNAPVPESTKKKIRKLDIAGELRSVYSKMTADVLSSTGVSMKRVSVRETPRVIQWLWEKYSEIMADNRQLATRLKISGETTKYPQTAVTVNFCLFPGSDIEVPRISNMHEKVGGSLKDLTDMQISQVVQEALCRELPNNQGVYMDEIIRSHQGLGALQVVGIARNVLRRMAKEEESGVLNLMWTWATLCLGIQVRMRSDPNIRARGIIHCVCLEDAGIDMTNFQYMAGDLIMAARASMALFYEHVRTDTFMDPFDSHAWYVDFAIENMHKLQGFEMANVGPAFVPVDLR